MKKPLKTTDAIDKWMDGINSGILRPNFEDAVESKSYNVTTKELESQKHINEIKAQGIEEAVKKADNETYIGVIGDDFPPQKQYRAVIT